MTNPAFNTVAWFQVGSNEPEQAKKFYGELFGWTYAADPNTPGYELVKYSGNDIPNGGIAQTPDTSANHAIFSVLVADVEATVAAAERLGAKVVVPPTSASNGLVFAELNDSSGNHFGVFTPAPAANT